MIDAMTDETNVPADESKKNEIVPPPAAAQGASHEGASSVMPKSAEQMRADMANILKEIKLPERHDQAGAADTKKQIAISPLLTDIDAPIPTKPAQPAQVEMPAAAAEEPEAASSVVSLHTLKQDLQHVVRDQKMSVVRATALEADKRRPTPEEAAAEPPAPRSKFTSYLLASVALLALGALALFGVYYVESSKRPAEQTSSTAIVFAEQSVSLPLSGHDPASLKQTLASARSASNASLGSITRIVPVVGSTTASQRPATLREFLSAIGAQPPDDLVRALDDNFFLGLHTVDKNAPLIVVPVVNYDRAFAGMLAWENTMNGDLAPFFTPLSQYTTVSGIPVQRTFSDLVIRNYDVRALKDDSGTVELYYSFPTRNILIIAESPYTFTEVLTRLQADRKL